VKTNVGSGRWLRSLSKRSVNVISGISESSSSGIVWSTSKGFAMLTMHAQPGPTVALSVPSYFFMHA